MVDSEEWRPVVGWPLYEVSSQGEVRNIRTGRILRKRLNPQGYLLVDLHTGKRFGLSNETKQTTQLVSRIVCRAFHGDPPDESYQAAHNNGIPSDNSPGNLRWDTAKGNIADKKIHGTENEGARNGGCKLTPDQALAILNDPRRPYSVIADEYGIHPGQVGKIKRREKWAHLQGSRDFLRDRIRKISHEDEIAIFKDPRSQATIARDYGISQGYVRKIKRKMAGAEYLKHAA